jgi:hypothetical protein
MLNNSVFSADVAVVAIDLMLDQWRNDLGERAFAKAWAAAWHGKTILRCQALDGFPGGLPASNNMLRYEQLQFVPYRACATLLRTCLVQILSPCLLH